MRAQDGTARRYAKALHSAAVEAGAGEAAGRELDAFVALVDASRPARDVLERPWIKPHDRRAVAESLADGAGTGALVKSFVGLLAERDRVDHLEAIARAYRDLVDADLGQARAEVRTAVALTAEEKDLLARRLQAAVGKRIVIEETVDTTLLGGFVARVGSLILDGSLDGQLARLRERLVRGEA